MAALDEMTQYSNDYAARAKAYRDALAASLEKQGQQTFQQANPYILEDLNARGFATSPTATAQAQTDALKNIALQNQATLTNYDMGTFDQTEALKQAGLERDYALADQARADALAESLASRASRDSLTSGLMGLGGNVLQGYTMGKALGGGGLGGLFGGGGSAAGATTGGLGATGVTGSAGLAPGSTLGMGGGTGTAGAGVLPWAGGIAAGFGGGTAAGQLAGNAIFKSKKAEKRARTGATVGAGTGTAIGSMFGPAGSAVGGLIGGAIGQGIGGLTASHAAGQVSKQFKNLVSKPGKTIANAPKNVVKSASKAISKAFCFTAGTMVEMADGTKKAIESITLGENTRGGLVFSIRVSMPSEGDLFNYLGTNLTGTHAVLENGVWTRVENSAYGIRTDKHEPVYSLVTENHRIYINGNTFADEFEHDEYEEITMDESLKLLNLKEAAHA